MIKLCAYTDIDEASSRGFNINGKSLFAIKKDGEIFVYENLCPHLNIALEFAPNQFLDNEQAFIVCSNHGALFEIETGNCISGPCINQSLTPLPFEVKENMIFLSATT